MSYPIPRISTSSPNRLHSPLLWRGALEKFDPDFAQYYFEDFLYNQFANTTDASSAGGWFVQDMAAGGTSESFVTTDGPDGLATLSAATGTAHFGISTHRGPTATSGATINLPSHPTAAKGLVIFECRVDITAAEYLFAGLTEALAEYETSTTTQPATSDYIGFAKGPSAALEFVTANDNNGGTAVTTNIDLHSAANAPTGLTKLGFRVNPDQSVEIFVNGEKIITDVNGSTINVLSTALPIETLVERFSSGRSSGSASTVALPIDWVATYVGV